MFSICRVHVRWFVDLQWSLVNLWMWQNVYFFETFDERPLQKRRGCHFSTILLGWSTCSLHLTSPMSGAMLLNSLTTFSSNYSHPIPKFHNTYLKTKEKHNCEDEKGKYSHVAKTRLSLVTTLGLYHVFLLYFTWRESQGFLGHCARFPPLQPFCIIYSFHGSTGVTTIIVIFPKLGQGWT